jgi:hypothetical protein
VLSSCAFPLAGACAAGLGSARRQHRIRRNQTRAPFGRARPPTWQFLWNLHSSGESGSPHPLGVGALYLGALAAQTPLLRTPLGLGSGAALRGPLLPFCRQSLLFAGLLGAWPLTALRTNPLRGSHGQATRSVLLALPSVALVWKRSVSFIPTGSSPAPVGGINSLPLRQV